jgi:hypothetical protein
LFPVDLNKERMMDGKCTVYFDDPFWVGIFERNDENGYSAARYVFGSEPGDAGFLLFCKNEFSSLKFSAAVLPLTTPLERMNFKRRQREVRKQMAQTGIGTYAQRALKAEYERRKELNKHETAENHKEEARQKVLREQAAKKEKRKGR